MLNLNNLDIKVIKTVCGSFIVVVPGSHNNVHLERFTTYDEVVKFIEECEEDV